MFDDTERNRIYQMALSQLDTQFERARRDVLFNLAIRRHDEGAKEAARFLFRLAMRKLDIQFPVAA